MRKIFHRIHLWLSVPFGLLITVVCLTGAALVFQKEVTACQHPDLYYVEEIAPSKLPVGQLVRMVAATLPDSVSVSGITITADPRKTYQVNLTFPRHGAILIDPYSGEVKGAKDRGAFFTFMLGMHRRLLGSRQPAHTFMTGKQAVGVSTLVLVVILLTGLFLWMPCARKNLKNKWKITVTKGWRRFWYDLHVVGGLYVTLFLLAMALTGLTWSFPWYRTAFYRLLGAETNTSWPAGGKNTPRPGGKGKHGTDRQKGNEEDGRRNEEDGRDEKKGDPFAQWQKVYDWLVLSNPDYKQITLSDGSASVLFGRPGNQRASDRYLFDPLSGEITQRIAYDAQETSDKIPGWIYSVHVGSWGGMVSRILYFLAALAGGMLPLTGYYLWIEKWRRREKPSRRKGLQS